MKLKQMAAAAVLAAGGLAQSEPSMAVQASSEAVASAVASKKTTPSEHPMKDLGSRYKAGMSYVEFRTQLLEDDWKPDGDSEGFLDSMLGSNYKDICSVKPSSFEANICALSIKFPEAVICQSTGSGGCLMSFKKGHMHVDINTSGDIASVFDSSHKYGFYADEWHVYIK